MMRRIHMFAILIVIVAGLHAGVIGFFGKDLSRVLLGAKYSRWAYAFVGIAALALVFHRDTYLPFLGEAVFPCSQLIDRSPPDATQSVQVTVAPGAKVIYFASEPANEPLKELKSWREAYLNYENAGVATADHNGIAVLKVRKPQPYRAGMKNLEPHVHYRVCADGGMMGRIETVFL
jgi:uncharacterized membrane protein YuzA (DUF378 family)